MIKIKHFKALSETEMEIMEVLWTQENPISTTALLDYFNNEKLKVWKAQTLATFLVRLVAKGLIISEHKGRGTVHSPAISLNEYDQLKASNVLNKMYKGSIKNFLAALYGDQKISNDEIAELKKWLSER